MVIYDCKYNTEIELWCSKKCKFLLNYFTLGKFATLATLATELQSYKGVTTVTTVTGVTQGR